MYEYIKIIWEGNDGKPSIKRIMSIVAFILYIILCCHLALNNPEIVIGSLVTMVLSLLGITTYQTLQYLKQDTSNDTEPEKKDTE